MFKILVELSGALVVGTILCLGTYWLVQFLIGKLPPPEIAGSEVEKKKEEK